MPANRCLNFLTAGTLVVLLLPAPVARANSHRSGWVWVDDDGGTIEVGAEGGSKSEGRGSSETSGSDARPVCTWERVPDDHIIVKRRAATGQDVVLYFKTCPGQPRQVVEVSVGASAVNPTAAWERALELLALPTPHIGVNPSEPVVHVETWLWVDRGTWGTRTQTASAGGVTATVTATPSRVTWDMGNGDRVICEGPGNPYDPAKPARAQSTDCSYTYRHSSAGQPAGAYQVTATVEWGLSWRVAGAAGGGTLPATSNSISTALPVGEMQALNQ